MQEHKGSWESGSRRDELVLAWPNYPEILNTLLSAVGVAGIFLGLGTLTQQAWVTWLGLVVSAGVLGSHVVRYRRASAQRQMAREMLGARLICHCRRVGGPSFMQTYYDGNEQVVLLLTDDALHICQADTPLRISSTIPFYDIQDVQVGPVKEPLWDSDIAGETLEDKKDVLNLAVRMSGPRVYRLAFCDFERHAPAEAWATALSRVVERRVPEGAG
jgi:hypothetical protein